MSNGTDSANDGVLSKFGGPWLCFISLVVLLGSGWAMFENRPPGAIWYMGFLVLWFFGHGVVVTFLREFASSRDALTKATDNGAYRLSRIEKSFVDQTADLKQHINEKVVGLKPSIPPAPVPTASAPAGPPKSKSKK